MNEREIIAKRIGPGLFNEFYPEGRKFSLEELKKTHKDIVGEDNAEDFTKVYRKHYEGMLNDPAYLVKEIAYWRTKIELQEKHDLASGNPLTPQTLKAMELFQKWLDILEKIETRRQARKSKNMRDAIDFSKMIGTGGDTKDGKDGR